MAARRRPVWLDLVVDAAPNASVALRSDLELALGHRVADQLAAQIPGGGLGTAAGRDGRAPSPMTV